ncbi:MAG: biotin transporter BioY [Lachnospiraceae bacterium]|nr:biotin transporter BioY [Lachnospiraceae bacterium]
MERQERSQRFRSIDMAYIAIGTAILTVCSWITIPSVVPFTLQTFAVILILGMLGGRRGTFSILLYILLGLIGVPVFSGFRGGPAALFGTTGGYILGFVLTGLLWSITEKAVRRAADPETRMPLPLRFLAAILGMAVCYFFGTVWFMILYTRNTGAISLGTALAWCVIPFIIPDLIKLVLAVALSGKLRKLAKIRD